MYMDDKVQDICGSSPTLLSSFEALTSLVRQQIKSPLPVCWQWGYIIGLYYALSRFVYKHLAHYVAVLHDVDTAGGILYAEAVQVVVLNIFAVTQ